MNTILGKKAEKEEINKQKEKISAVLRDDNKEISFEKALAISTAAHPLSIFLSWFFIKLLILILAFLGITLPMFMKPEPKMRDIEFVIVNNPEQDPINKNTNLRADRNTRAGGKHDPTKKIAEPEPVVAPSKPQQASPPPRPTPAPTPPKPQTAPKVPPRPAPQMTPSPPKVQAPTPFSVPVPVVKDQPRVSTPYGGPVTVGPIAQAESSSEPAPVMSGSSSGQNSLRRSGYSMGSGTPGNPGPGNPGGRPGIDALKEPDFGPYMRELQRRIKRNWNPPRGNKSKRVVLVFKLGRDGRLLSLKVDAPSGNPESDHAALEAVKASAPFRPLPAEYRGNDVDIQFTFDYNVFGVGGQQF